MKKDKAKTVFVCQNCGNDSPKWLGKCPECDQWNSFVEEKFSSSDKSQSRRLTEFSTPILRLDEISLSKTDRIKTGINEFDRMLGGGIMPSSLILLGGSPGIGKSTLMLQVAYNLAGKTDNETKVLYVSGEESLEQIKNRAERLNILSQKKQGLMLMSETSIETIIEKVNKISPQILIIDSIQTTYKNEMSGAAGSVGQIRECAAELLSLAKGKNITVFLLGHVTKDGDIAGPRVLEHIVDTVLYFETEKHHTYRILRSHKNRFGPTSEIGVFEMKPSGLEEVSNPSMLFLSERTKDISGSAISVTIEGTRPILLEIQSLVTKTDFGMPRRMSDGIDYNRMVVLLAILENRLGLGLASQDVYVNVAGGVKIKEPSVDLAVCCAVYSSLTNFHISPEVVFTGEVGLSGEIRAVSYIQERINESEKIGFKKIFIPKHNSKGILKPKNIDIVTVETLSQVIESLRKTINN
ncbi:MAG: DNA repair protein RadA [Elusimicrobia bacterium RIFOXYA2_FULL_39_19]|nr:MAG: DNA repair protein RadA [Elusimicrobia bacterium RIFOXYA2_FULL_39_19]